MKRLLFSVLLFILSFSIMGQNNISHTVQRGETCNSIATKYGISLEDLIKANPKAKNFFYVGMTLTIPNIKTQASSQNESQNSVRQNQTKKNVNDKNKIIKAETYKSQKETKNKSDKEYKDIYYSATFFCPNFNSITESSSYGLLLDAFNLYDSHVGITWVPGSFNFGIAEKGFESAIIMLGPNVSAQLSKNVLFVLPICVICNYYGDSDYKKITGDSMVWGWMINPKVLINVGKFGFQLGFVLNGGFKGGKVNAGFNVALGI